VTASLPFDGPSSIVVLKKIVRGVFTIPNQVPKELQDLIRLMLTMDPKERITIQQIKQHPWYLGAEETPRQYTNNVSEGEYIITMDDIADNSDVLSNLRLLGWEESELMNDLLDNNNKLNPAKTFFKLLMEHKNNSSSSDEQNDTPLNIETKVLRRRSIGANTSRIGVASENKRTPNISRSHSKDKTRKRASTRAVQSKNKQFLSRTQTPPQRSQKTISQTPQRQSTQSPQFPRQSTHSPQFPRQATHSPQIPRQATHSPQILRQSGHSRSEKGNPKNILFSNSSESEKEYQIESNKSVTEILEALKHCFADLGKFDLSAKQTKTGIKVKARRSGKRHGNPIITVNLLQREGDASLIFKSGKSKEEFKEVIKKVEENLVVN